MSLQTLRNVVTSSTRMYHRPHHLDVDNVCELSRFLEIVEAVCFDHLSSYFVCYLRGTIVMNSYYSE